MVRGATHPAAASAPAIPPQPQHPARPSSDFWTQPPIQRPMRGLWRIETQATTCNGTESGNKAVGLDGPPSTAVPPRADWPPTPPLSSSASKTTFTSGNGTGGSYSPSTQQPHRHSSQKSKNDIFEHPSPVLTPPKPPPALPPMMTAHASLDSAPAPASPSTGPKSRNSLFFETPSSSPSFAVWRGTWQPNADVTASPTLASASSRQPPPTPPLPQPPSASASASTWDESRPLYTSTSLSRDTQRPSLGRLSSEEQQRERDRIRGASKEIDFRLTPSKQNLLGEGRHCNVYLGAYRKRGGAGGRVGEWQLCAIKRLHADRQSQLLGLDEGFALRRIGRHPGIVALIDIRDEVMAPTPAPTTSASSTLGLGRPPSNSVSLHGRSTSAAQQQARGRGAAGRTQQHMRLASQPVGHAQTPQVRISGQDGSSIDEWSNRSDDEYDCPSSASALAEQQQQQQAAAEAASIPPSISADPPRLLILLELLPHSLAAYSRRHSNSITLDFWMRTALDLSATIEYVHSRGCVHADIKPENVLLDDEGRTKLCDFNSAFFPSAASAPLTDGLGLGTPAYGAPELTRRGGSSSGGQKAVVSYPVDIFSLGAVLYGLATGVEPMSRARSAIDMLHRKEHFFATEENDRLTRVAIGKGWASSSSSNGGGGTGASRRSSTRSKRATKAGPRGSANESSMDSGSPSSRRSSLRRQGSTDSMSTSADGSKRSSLASSVTTIAGQKPSMAAVEALLHPGDEAGVLPVPEGSGRGHRYVNAAAAAAAGQAIKAATNQEGNQHHRASSLNKNKQQDPREVDMTADASSARPAWLRRTTSYGGPETVSGAGSSADMNPSPTFQASNLLSPPTSPNHRLLPSAHINAGSELAAHSLQQRLFKQQIPHARGHARTPSLDSTASSSSLSTSHTAPGDDGESEVDSTTDPSQDGDGQDEDEEGPDDTPYIDGSPALLLPGGGRLPQSALDLLEQMLLPDPKKRPGVAEVRRRLELVEKEVYDYAEGEKGP